MKTAIIIFLVGLFTSCESWNIHGSPTGGSGDNEESSNDSSLAAPTSLSLSSPSSSPTVDRTPEITVQGVESGNTVSIYSDSSCSTQVATGTAAGTSLTLTLNSQTAGSTYSYYANRSNGAITSSCSTATVSLTINSCPSNFIAVPHNDDYTSEDFCVAKFEMRNSSGAVSQSSGTPEVSINLATATSNCTALGSGYDLISNAQWQTIARNIESRDSNWFGGVKGTNYLNTGHSNNDPTSNCDSTQEYVGTDCNNSGGESDFKQKRTHTLTNDEVIWDFSGNVNEWVKDTNTGSTDYGNTVRVYEITSASHTTTGSLDDGVNRDAKGHFGPEGDYTSLNSGAYGGLGYAELNANNAISRGSNRGSGFQFSGVFAVSVIANTSQFANLGYRCVYTE